MIHASKLHGPDWHPKGKTSSFKSFNPEAENSISKGHLVTAEAFVAKIGLTNSTHKSLSCTRNNYWIIMTCDDHKFSSLSYIYSKIIVTNANCMSSPIISSGTVLFLPFS